MIEVRGVTKSLDGHVAVDDISFKVEEGEIFGILGPNGAGKTTLISMLSTSLKPDSGAISVFDLDSYKHAGEIRKSIGVVFQNPTLDEKLTGIENLWMGASLYGVPKEEIESRIKEKLILVGLEEWGDSLVNKFSWGMKRRLELARALVSNPKLLLMDEPTLGLDPKARHELWDHFKGLNVTIVLSTNYMEEAENLCNRVALMDNGKIVAMDTIENLKSAVRGDILVLKVRDPAKLKQKLSKKYRNMKVVGEKLIITVKNGEDAIPILSKIAGKELESIEMRYPTLNDVFLHYTGKEIKESGEENEL